MPYGAEPENIEVIKDGVDTRIFKRTNGTRPRREFGESAENIIMFQGVIAPQDSPEIILGTAREVLKKGYRVMFRIIGHGTTRS